MMKSKPVIRNARGSALGLSPVWKHPSSVDSSYAYPHPCGATPPGLLWLEQGNKLPHPSRPPRLTRWPALARLGPGGSYWFRAACGPAIHAWPRCASRLGWRPHLGLTMYADALTTRAGFCPISLAFTTLGRHKMQQVALPAAERSGHCGIREAGLLHAMHGRQPGPAYRIVKTYPQANAPPRIARMAMPSLLGDLDNFLGFRVT